MSKISQITAGLTPSQPVGAAGKMTGQIPKLVGGGSRIFAPDGRDVASVPEGDKEALVHAHW